MEHRRRTLECKLLANWIVNYRSNVLTWETSSQMIIVVAKPWWRCYESLMIRGGRFG